MWTISPGGVLGTLAARVGGREDGVETLEYWAWWRLAMGEVTEVSRGRCSCHEILGTPWEWGSGVSRII